MDPVTSYEWLCRHSIDTSYLVSCAELLAWDQRTQIPQKGHGHRIEQMASIAKLLHERSTNPRIQDHLLAVEESPSMKDGDLILSANVREWRREYDRSIRVPQDLAVALARATAEGESVWEKARPLNDWDSFCPYLKTTVSLMKEKADALGFVGEPYDALVDEFEPGETAAGIEALFRELKTPAVSLLRRIVESPVKPKTEILHRSFPEAEQQSFVHFLLTRIGFDFDAGRIDKTAHPFAVGIGPGDVRITTRYFPGFFNPAIFGGLHEAGHGLYEQGLLANHWGTPAGMPASLGVHESQSRLWENLVGRSQGFWGFAFPHAVKAFPCLEGVEPSAFLLAINAVAPSLIRVEADEISYNLHVLMRFELELEIFRGHLSVEDLPDAWNEKMKEYLGIVPSCVGDGVMQDVHWSAGLFGYFPTYTLGNIYAAQLFNAADRELGDLTGRFADGDFSDLLDWLQKKIHQFGRTCSPKDLIARATGEPPSPRAFIDYCESKFSRLYKL